MALYDRPFSLRSIRRSLISLLAAGFVVLLAVTIIAVPPPVAEGWIPPAGLKRTPAFVDDMFDPTFAGGTVTINHTVVQPDGKVLVGGVFTTVEGIARRNLVRLDAGGKVDTSFNPGTGPNASVNSIALQPDGKIIIIGDFISTNGRSTGHIARLNPDGSVDGSFAIGTGAAGKISAVAVQPDGKILLGGSFVTFNNTVVNHICRLNTDGGLDDSFAAGTGATQQVRKIIVMPDGDIVIAGDFSGFNGATKAGIVRLYPNGSDDTSFNTGTGSNDSVHDLVRQQDGKLVIVGSFTTFDGAPRAGTARLHEDGSLDMSFDSGLGFDGDLFTIVALPDGKFMVGGNFATAGGLRRNCIARLHSDGRVDPKLLVGLGPSGSSSVEVRSITPHNGRYLVSGRFDTFNTSARSGLVRIANATKTVVDFDGDGITDIAIVRHYGGPGRLTYWIRFSSTGTHVSFDFGIFTIDSLQPGDYDGDGITDIAVWRGAEISGQPVAYWMILSGTNSVTTIPFGLTGDRPVGAEDYDGDGKDDMATYRTPNDLQGPGQGTWFYRGSFNNPNNNITYVPFGMRYGTQADQVDKPVIGDFDGDGKADFRVRRRLDTSVGTLSTPAISYTLTATGNRSIDYFGWAGDRSMPGDYDGDGKTDEAIARGFNQSGVPISWFIRYANGSPDARFQWGLGGFDQFAQGDYDGDGITDPTVYRRAGENNFYILRSSNQTMQVFHWGQDDPTCGPACDIAVATYNNR